MKYKDMFKKLGIIQLDMFKNILKLIYKLTWVIISFHCYVITIFSKIN